MKKLISFCLTIVLCLSFAVSVEAESKNTYWHGEIEIIFEDGNALNENTKLYIAEMLVDGYSYTEESTTYNLLCTLFGHNYEEAQLVETIEHKVDIEEPRCLSRMWEVFYCPRCEHVQSNLLSQKYIFCCPED